VSDKYDKGARRALAAAAVASLALAVAAVLALPGLARRRVERALASLPEGVRAKARSVDVSWRRGVLVIEGLEAADDVTGFRLAVERVELGLSGLVRVERPTLWARIDWVPVKEREKLKALRAKQVARVKEIAGGLSPRGERGPRLWRFKRLEVFDGVLHDPSHEKGGVPILDEVAATLDRHGAVVHLRAKARVLRSGRAEAGLRLERRSPPTFDLSFRLKDLDLPSANVYLLRRFGVDVLKGSYDLAVDASGGDGGFRGEAQPRVRGLDMHPNGPGLKKALKELYIAHQVERRKDKSTGALGKREPFSGRFGTPGAWQSVLTMRAACIQALKRALR
jgi:hypothetical protein